MLEGVLAAGGTAEEAQVPGYVLAGKTGTAEKIDPDTGAYSQHPKFFSSFIGFAPAKKSAADGGGYGRRAIRGCTTAARSRPRRSRRSWSSRCRTCGFRLSTY